MMLLGKQWHRNPQEAADPPGQQGEIGGGSLGPFTQTRMHKEDARGGQGDF